MLKRTITSVVLIVILAGLFFIGRFGIGAAVVLFTALGIWELYNAVENKGVKPIKWTCVLFAIPVLLYVLLPDSNFFPISMYTIATIIFLVCIFSPKKHTFLDAIITLIAGVVVSNMFYTIMSIYNMGDTKIEATLLVVLLLLGTCVTDTSAYFVGVTIGKHKLAPEVSPQKSIEGSIAGIIFVTAAVAIYGYYVLNRQIEAFSNFTIWIYITLGLVCGIISQVGDLAASMLKRHYGVKDFGKIFPGHGGILDRFDSFLFLAPVIFYFIRVSMYLLEI